MNAIPLEKVIYMYATVFDGGDEACADMDKSVIQLSWAQGTSYMHHIVADVPQGTKETITYNGYTHSICLWPSERDLICALWETMNAVAMFPDTTIIGGWAIRHTLWPLLITKGMHYGMQINPMFKSDPVARFGSTSCLLDLTGIYVQGAYSGWRRYPELADFLTYMGVPQTGDTPYHITEEQFCNYTIEDWKDRGYKQVSAYLYGMQCVVTSYYG